MHSTIRNVRLVERHAGYRNTLSADLQQLASRVIWIDEIWPQVLFEKPSFGDNPPRDRSSSPPANGRRRAVERQISIGQDADHHPPHNGGRRLRRERGNGAASEGRLAGNSSVANGIASRASDRNLRPLPVDAWMAAGSTAEGKPPRSKQKANRNGNNQKRKRENCTTCHLERAQAGLSNAETYVRAAISSSNDGYEDEKKEPGTVSAAICSRWMVLSGCVGRVEQQRSDRTLRLPSRVKRRRAARHELSCSPCRTSADPRRKRRTCRCRLAPSPSMAGRQSTRSTSRRTRRVTDGLRCAALVVHLPGYLFFSTDPTLVGSRSACCRWPRAPW